MTVSPDLPALRARLATVRAELDAIDAVMARWDEAAEPSDLMRPREVAACLGVSIPTVYRLMDRGDLPERAVGRSRRVPRAAVEAIQRGQAQPPSQPRPPPPPASRPTRATRRVTRLA